VRGAPLDAEADAILDAAAAAAAAPAGGGGGVGGGGGGDEAAALLGVRQFFSLLPRGNHSSAQAAALLSLLDRLTFHQAPAT